MKVKVCGMTEVPNLNRVLEAKPDFIGFIFYDESSRLVTDFNVIGQDMGNAKKVGVFVNENLNEVIRITAIHGLDYVQLHGDESSSYCQELQTKQIKIVKAFSVDRHFDFKQLRLYKGLVDYFLFDTKGENRGGNGVKFDWSILHQYQLEIPFFLSGGIERNDVEEIKSINHPQLYAIDINSRFEKLPGIKDVDSVTEFIKELRK